MDMKMALEAIRSEMKPSMGCTEPVAIGLAVSRACALLEKPATHLDMVISSMHVHATHDTCVEAVIAKGSYDKLKVFCENTIAEKGVGCGEINYLPIHEHK